MKCERCGHGEHASRCLETGNDGEGNWGRCPCPEFRPASKECSCVVYLDGVAHSIHIPSNTKCPLSQAARPAKADQEAEYRAFVRGALPAPSEASAACADEGCPHYGTPHSHPDMENWIDPEAGEGEKRGRMADSRDAGDSAAPVVGVRGVAAVVSAEQIEALRAEHKGKGYCGACENAAFGGCPVIRLCDALEDEQRCRFAMSAGAEAERDSLKDQLKRQVDEHNASMGRMTLKLSQRDDDIAALRRTLDEPAWPTAWAYEQACAAIRKRDAFLEREGYRRCDIAACNCGEWHRDTITICDEDTKVTLSGKPGTPWDVLQRQEIQAQHEAALAGRDAELTQLREALGLLTTLHPSLEIDATDPVGMAQKIEAHVREQLATAIPRDEYDSIRLKIQKRWADDVEKVEAERDALIRAAVDPAAGEWTWRDALAAIQKMKGSVK